MKRGVFLGSRWLKAAFKNLFGRILQFWLWRDIEFFILDLTDSRLKSPIRGDPSGQGNVRKILKSRNNYIIIMKNPFGDFYRLNQLVFFTIFFSPWNQPSSDPPMFDHPLLEWKYLRIHKRYKSGKKRHSISIEISNANV